MSSNGKKRVDYNDKWVEINLANLKHNLGLIKSYCSSPDTKIMALVKANAYGHGAVQISKYVLENGAYSLGVAFADEGMELRKAGISAPVYVLGETGKGQFKEAVDNNLILSINSLKSARDLSDICGACKIMAKVNINIDTGMNRLGINHQNAVDTVDKILKLKNLKAEGIFTHIACSAGKGDSYTRIQLKRFEEIINSIKRKRMGINFFHCANSATFFRFRQSHMNMVRIGISMYGFNPFDNDCMEWLPEDSKKAIEGLRPVLSLKTRISFIKEVAAGEIISYCGKFKTKRKSVIATVPVGYSDGYSRILSNRAEALLSGRRVPVVGTITMNFMMLDITNMVRSGKVDVGDEVILIGESPLDKITADELADIMGTINYEITCMIKESVPRRYMLD